MLAEGYIEAKGDAVKETAAQQKFKDGLVFYRKVYETAQSLIKPSN
jgi:hypothetical protein